MAEKVTVQSADVRIAGGRTAHIRFDQDSGEFLVDI